MNISKQVVILSAESKNNTFEGNRQRTENLKACLQDCNIPFNTATGVFENGSEETSLVAIVKDEVEIQTLTDFAFKNFDQDAILHQDANQEAHLIHKDGTSIAIGRLEQVTKEVAFEKGSYTLLNGVYYTTVPRPTKSRLL